jgi:hypothetical protein
MPDQSHPQPDEIGFYFGRVESVPIDLEKEAADHRAASCHVCDSPARVIVEMLDDDRALGDAIFLCDEDFGLIYIRDRDSLSIRLAANYGPSDDSQTTAALMVEKTGRAVRLSGVSSA